MRSFRRTRLLATTGVALAALALTACEDGTGTRDEGASRPATTAPEAKEPTASEQPTATGRPSEPTGNPEEPGNPQGTEKPQSPQPSRTTGGKPAATPTTCNGTNTRVTAQPVPRPLNHMLLTVTNTGTKPCNLPYYPVLRFDEMQWVPQAMPGTKPQAVPTLAPGESGYAGVRLAAADGSGSGGATGRRLTVGFQGGTPNSDGGPSATPALPAKGVYYDSSLAVTYWQSSMEDALN